MTPILARQKPDRSLERLYKKHAGDVYRYALVVLRNEADAEDVTQTTFMNAYKALERGERPRTPQNWLIAIAHNVCRQRFRQSQRRPHEAELAISKQLDGRLPRQDRGALRAHLRECEECARFARSQRAQRGAIKSLAAIPLPTSLGSLFGGGSAGTGAAIGGGLAVQGPAGGAGAPVA